MVVYGDNIFLVSPKRVEHQLVATTIADTCWPMKRSKYSDSDGLLRHNLLASFSFTYYPH